MSETMSTCDDVVDDWWQRTLDGRAVISGTQDEPCLWIVRLFNQYVLCDSSGDGWLMPVGPHTSIQSLRALWDLRKRALRRYSGRKNKRTGPHRWREELFRFNALSKQYYDALLKIDGVVWAEDPDVEERRVMLVSKVGVERRAA